MSAQLKPSLLAMWVLYAVKVSAPVYVWRAALAVKASAHKL